jgi:hypothetical protein
MLTTVGHMQAAKFVDLLQDLRSDETPHQGSCRCPRIEWLEGEKDWESKN